jgi:hypothetical protein
VKLGQVMVFAKDMSFGERTLCDGTDPEGNVFQIANG